MGKFKTTKKELKSIYKYIVRAGYCELQTLLKYPAAREVAYASGVYGWNWDAYEIKASNGSSVCICTGYRDMIGERIEGVAEFEKKALNIWDYNNPKHKGSPNAWEEREKDSTILIREFADFVIKKLEG